MVDKEKIAEFIGIMLGDGCFGIYNCKSGRKIKKQYRIRISLDSRNKEYLDYINHLMKEVLDTQPRIYFKKKENAVDIATYRKDKFSYVLNEIGLKTSPKWNKMEIPAEYANGKLGLLVLKGLFDTDGCLSVFNNNGTVYPANETTQKFIKENWEKHPEIFRHSWSTFKNHEKMKGQQKLF